MQAQSNVPYQAYRPKRHGRNVSGQSNGQNHPPHNAPQPAARPQSVYSQLNGDGYIHGHDLSEQVVPLQRDFHPASEKEIAVKDVHDAVGLRMNLVVDEGRRTVSMTNVIPSYEVRREASPPTASLQPSPDSTLAATSPRSPSPDNIESPGTTSPSSSEQSTPLSTSPSRPPSTVQPAIATELSVTRPDPPSPELKPEVRDAPVATSSATMSSTTSPSPSNASSPGPSPRLALSSLAPSRKGSTFRRIVPRAASARNAVPPSSLRPRTPSSLSTANRVLDLTPAQTPEPANRMLSPLAAPVPISSERALPPLPALELPGPIAQPATQAYRPYTPASVSHRPVVSPTIVSPSIGSFPTHGSSTIPPTISPAPSSSSTLAPVQRAPSAPGVRSRTPAPYRPGFQPKGVYRPRTDEFLEARKQRNDQDRVERTRLERRLEKLINLHFPHPDQKKEKDSLSVRPGQNRRASSFFDIDISTLKGKSAGDLWKGVVQAQAAGGKNDIRAAEQTIAPWEDDASVSKCPLCAASFHPLTNRKHHCRLCGRIICSLPVKYPQRSQSCSLLFVAEPLTGQVEEVGEGVDYGVRRRTNSMGPNSVKGKGRDDAFGLNEDEKFLKGVRICRDCRPVLQRRRYTQEAHTVPLFTRLYEAFVQVEKEIEETLPQFQELMLSLNNDERPSPEASAARKRLLEAFAQYDALAKRIRKLPCQGGPGGSQDRVQQAIVTRANIFLQKNMFPLQAMPKPQKASAAPSPTSESPKAPSPPVDPDSEVAKALQPLLEQEALLESFVEEAKAQRKFEDVQALKTSLIEIRTEIDRILAAADGGLSEHRPTPGRKTR